jgi:hypothetical protein
MNRGCVAVTALVGAGLVVYLTLHFLEPRLAITWSYAHLGRRAALPWVGAALVAMLPVVTVLAWRRPGTARPLRRVPWPWVVVGGVLLAVGLASVGVLAPEHQVSVDPMELLLDVHDRRPGNGRWVLLLWILDHLWDVGRRFYPNLNVFLRVVNGCFGAGALVALAACARRLGRSRGEVLAITLLAWTALGTLQVSVGYLEVYPAALFATAVYLWACLAAIDGALHPAWPVVVGALAPYFYVALVQLLPALVVVAATELTRPRGLRRLAVAAGLGLAAAGAATIPAFGYPFAWTALAARVSAFSARGSGLSPTSSLLPLDYVLSGTHAYELVHTFLLIDGVGVLLLLVAGTWALAARAVDAKAAFLALALAAFVPYVVLFDPVWGAYGDWDLFSYLAAPISLLGSYCFVQWGRRCPQPFAVLLGLALTANGVHLLARLNAVAFDMARHQAESPDHLRRMRQPSS